MKTIIFLSGLFVSFSCMAQSAPSTEKVCKIVNVRPLTKEEMIAKGYTQINYGTIYLQQLVCQPKGDSK